MRIKEYRKRDAEACINRMTHNSTLEMYKRDEIVSQRDRADCCETVCTTFREYNISKTIIKFNASRTPYTVETIKMWCNASRFFGFPFYYDTEHSSDSMHVLYINGDDMESASHNLATFSVARYLWSRIYADIVDLTLHIRKEYNLPWLTCLYLGHYSNKNLRGGYYGLINKDLHIPRTLSSLATIFRKDNGVNNAMNNPSNPAVRRLITYLESKGDSDNAATYRKNTGAAKTRRFEVLVSLVETDIKAFLQIILPTRFPNKDFANAEDAFQVELAEKRAKKEEVANA